MPSEKYRVYCLDDDGHLHEPEWFHADSDEDAIAHVTTKRPHATCEIWHGRRLVASISPDRLTA
jgi:hypothetical protein